MKLVRGVKRMLALAALPAVVATFVMSAAPAAQAAPTAATVTAEVTADLFTPEEVAELTREWDAAQRSSGGVQARAIPVVIVGAITICAATAVGSVGQQVVENLIADGKVGEAKKLIASAISGCVFGVATAGAGALCKAFPPCRRAVQKAIEKAAQKIIDGLT